MSVAGKGARKVFEMRRVKAHHVHGYIESPSGKGLGQGFVIIAVYLKVLDTIGKGAVSPIEQGNGMPGPKCIFDNRGADRSGSSDNEDLHATMVSCRNED